MEHIKLASGDNDKAQVSNLNYIDQVRLDHEHNGNSSSKHVYQSQLEGTSERELNEITPQAIDDNEAKLKERIAQCRNVIESLKVELNEEKSKLEKQNKNSPRSIDCVEKCIPSQYISSSNSLIDDIIYNPETYSDCVDSRLTCDENLIEYEKQLQRYQNTLNMAQIEKRNAIRKQMLAKAYRLKLLEVENQCNIELLRVKQSLQCLEPLKIIASKWRSNSDDMYDVNSYELIPRYPELNTNSQCELNSNCITDTENEEIGKDKCITPVPL